MNTEQNHKEFETLCWKFFTHEASEQEKQMLLTMLNNSPELAAEFKHARSTYIATKHNTNSFNANNALSQFQSQVKRKQTTLYKKVLFAAGFVLLIGLGIVTWNMLSTPHQHIEYVAFSSDEHLKDHINLPDGSSVMMHQQTQIAYDITTEHARNVILHGEAFFDVTPQEHKPFIIHIDELTVTVLGTSFIIDAVSDVSKIFVHVLTGSVHMQVGEAFQVVTAQQTGIYTKQQSALHVVSDIDKNDIAWKTNELDFKGETLEQALMKFSKFFNTEFIIVDKEIGDYQLSARFSSPEITEVIELLELAYTIEFITEENRIFVTHRAK